MTTGKTIALTRGTFVGKVMSLLFNKLSRLVIAFLPRSKRLLISWLQSPSAVILEPKRIKSVTVSIVSPSICHEVMGLDAMILVFWMLNFSQLFHSPVLLTYKTNCSLQMLCRWVYIGKVILDQKSFPKALNSNIRCICAEISVILDQKSVPKALNSNIRCIVLRYLNFRSVSVYKQTAISSIMQSLNQWLSSACNFRTPDFSTIKHADCWDCTINDSFLSFTAEV